MGIAEGYNAKVNAYNAIMEQRYKRKELELQRQAQEAELRSQGFDQDGNLIPTAENQAKEKENEARLHLMEQIVSGMQNKEDKNETTRAIGKTIETKDATHLNNALKNNPRLAQLWADQGVFEIANIDWERDKYLLNTYFPPHALDTPEKQKAVDNMTYKIYDGENWKLGSEAELVQMTNALEFLPQSTVEQYVSDLAKFNAALSGTDTKFEQNQANREFAADREDAKFEQNQANKEYLRGVYEWEQEFLLTVREAQDKLNKGENLLPEEKKLLGQENLINKLPENYFEISWEDLTNEDKSVLRTLANSTEDKLSTSQIDGLEITSRLLLGGKILGETITPTNVGFIDNAIDKIKLYVVDTERNQHARSAYYTIFNNIAKLMSGLTLTKHEIAASKNQMGTLNIQPKQLLVNMQTLYSSIYEGLEARANAMNPWVGRFYYGKLMDETKQVLNNINTALRENTFDKPEDLVNLRQNPGTGGRNVPKKPENKPMSDAQVDRMIEQIENEN